MKNIQVEKERGMVNKVLLNYSCLLLGSGLTIKKRKSEENASVMIGFVSNCCVVWSQWKEWKQVQDTKRCVSEWSLWEHSGDR